MVEQCRPLDPPNSGNRFVVLCQEAPISIPYHSLALPRTAKISRNAFNTETPKGSGVVPPILLSTISSILLRGPLEKSSPAPGTPEKSGHRPIPRNLRQPMAVKIHFHGHAAFRRAVHPLGGPPSLFQGLCERAMQSFVCCVARQLTY